MDPHSLEIALSYIPAKDLIRRAIKGHIGTRTPAERQVWANLLKQRYPNINTALKEIRTIESGWDRNQALKELNPNSDAISLAIMSDLFPGDYMDYIEAFERLHGHKDAAFNVYLSLLQDTTKDWDAEQIVGLLQGEYYRAALYALRYTTTVLENTEDIIRELFSNTLDNHSLFRKLLFSIPIPQYKGDYAGGKVDILNFYVIPEQQITVFGDLIRVYPDLALKYIQKPLLVLDHIDTYGTTYLHTAARAGQPEIYDIIARQYPDLQFHEDDYGRTPNELMTDYYMKSINPDIRRV